MRRNKQVQEVQQFSNPLSRAWRLHETGFGLTIGFIGLNLITQLVITPYSSLQDTHTHTHTNLLSPGVTECLSD
jgi:hypothetical protein